MTENKTQQTDDSVQTFLQSIEDERKREDCFTLVELMQEITGEPARMWGKTIVGFDKYRYKYANGSEGESLLVGFAPRKANLSLYIMSGFDEYDALLEKLGKHKTGKACLYVKRLDDVDMDTLRELVQRSVDYMRDTYPTGTPTD
jgi:hypothetical protein